MTLQEFLQIKKIESQLSKLLSETLPLAFIRIREAIEGGERDEKGTENVHGEKQLKLDVEANEIFCEVLRNTGIVGLYASEEMEEATTLSNSLPLSLVFDPLDGSSLVDVNFAIGSIFGVYPNENLIGKKGRDMLAAGYVVYGSRASLVFSPGRGLGVHEFILGQDGLFSLSKENLRVEEKAKYFAPGNLRAGKERDDYKKLLDYWVSNGYTLRYSGGMVPDLNHIFLKGNGIFSYPPYSEAKQGKLRLLYECNPMAYLMEEAGGDATDGTTKILEKPLETLHQRTPIYIGSKEEVRRCEEFLRQST